MAIEDRTAANTALWARYLDDQWGPFLGPFGRHYLTRGVAAGIAGWLSLTYAPRVDRLFDENAPGVSRFVEERERRAATDRAERVSTATAPAPRVDRSLPDTSRTRLPALITKRELAAPVAR